MTLLNPALLLGLLLAGLPILIHLLGRRRLRREPFPTLAFLRRLQQKRLHRLRLRRWLLLALRTLALLALALAFLRPTWLGGSAAGAASSDTVVLLDLSPSMEMRDETGRSGLDRARDMLSAIWQAGGRLSVVVADESAQRDLPYREASGEAPRWVRELAVDGRAANWSAGFVRAAQRIAESEAASRELVLLSDFRDSVPDSLPTLAEGARLLKLPVAGKGAPANAAPVGLKLATALLRSEGQGELVARARLEGGDSLEAMATLSLAGRRRAEASMHLAGDTEQELRLTFRVPSPGRHRGELELAVQDGLLLDNRLPFVLEVPGASRVLIAGDDISAMRNLELALTAGRGQGLFEVKVRPGGVGRETLVGYDLLLLAGTAELSQGASARIEQFVRDGGGLWLFLSERSDPAMLSRGLLADLGFGAVVGGGRAEATSHWEQIDRDHPALRGLLIGEGRYDAPRIDRAYPSRPALGVRTLVRLADGRPFLLERGHGQGRAWLTLSAANRSWGDWPVSGIFAPVLRQGASWLATGSGGSEEPRLCGDILTWPAPEGDLAELSIEDPLGNSLPVEQGGPLGAGRVGTRQSEWPGHYALLRGTEEIGLKAVRLAPSESSLDLREQAWPGESLAAESGEELAAELEKLRLGRELAGYLLLLALLAMVAESVVAREGASSARGTEQA